MEGKGIFKLFGPGAIYGHNTLQNLVDLYMLNDPLNYNKDIPFISETAPRQIKGPDSLQLNDLIRTRAFFMDNIKIFFPDNEQRNKPEIIPEKNTNISIQIADSFLFPIINLATSANIEAAKTAITILSNYFRDHEWNGDNDISSLSEKLIQLLANTYSREDSTPEIHEETAKIWLELFHRKGRLDDIVLFLGSWINSKTRTIPNLGFIIESIKKEIIPSSFLREISNNKSKPFYSSILMNSTQNTPRNIKVAAHCGFLYLLDEQIGLVKLGTGINGTIYSSLEVENKSFTQKNPIGLAVNEKFVFVKCSNDPLTVCDPISLEIIGYVLFDGTFTQDITSNQLFVVNGSFTAKRDYLYISDGQSIFEYLIKDDRIEPTRIINLALHITLEPSTSLVCNGEIFLIVAQSADKYELSEFNLINGTLIQSQLQPDISSSNVAFDYETRALFFIGTGETSSYIICSTAITYLNKEPTNNASPMLTIFEILPALLISRQNNEFATKYTIKDMHSIYKVLDQCTQCKDGEQFITPIVQMIIIFLNEHPYCELPPPDLFQKIFNYISYDIKPFFIKAVFNQIRPPYNSQKVLFQIFETIDSKSIMKGIGMIEMISPELLVVLLQKTEILKEATSNLNHSSYAYIQRLIYSIMNGYFIENTFTTGMIIPLFVLLQPSNSHLFFSIMATLLPVLQFAMKDHLYFGALIPFLPSFIKKLHSFCPVKGLEEFARHHMSVCTDQPFSTQVTIDETPHPYHNNSDYVHTYEFKNAIEISIVFDQMTNTEANCDWLQVFTDRECIVPLTEKMSGRFNKWVSPITTHAKTISLKFHSDTSVNEWGYKATITQKIFSQKNYDSPDPRFDIYYSLCNIIIENMKNFKEMNNLDFKIDKFDKTDFDFDEDISDKIKELVGDEYIGYLYPLKIAMINHIHKYLKNEIKNKEMLLNIIRSPFAAINYTNEGFGNLANQLLFYIPPGISKQNRNFLADTINGSPQTNSFIEEALKFANNVFDLQNPSLTDCITAANKAIVAFKLMGTIDVKEAINLWFKCLKAISSIRIVPGSMTNDNFKILSKLGNYIVVENNFAEEFVNKHYEILIKTDINTYVTDAPVVRYALHRVNEIPVGSVSNETLLKFTLRVLEFNLPNIIHSVLEMINKFNIRTDEISEQFESIIRKIGNCYEYFLYNNVKTVISDDGKRFSYMLAYCLRQMLTEKSLNKLSTILNSDNWLGAAIMLSCRSFPISPSQKIRMKEENVEGTITAIDPLNISITTESKANLVVPLIDFTSLLPLKPEFDLILPEPLKGADQNLINSLLKHKNSYIALSALSEILKNSDCDFKQVYDQIKNVECHFLSERPTFHIFEEMTTMINKLPDTEGLRKELNGNTTIYSYIYDDTISLYHFEPNGDAFFGFCEKDNTLPSSAFLLKLTEKSIIFNNTVIIEHETIKVVKIGYLKETMELYISTGGAPKWTGIFIHPMNNPIPVIISRQKITKFDPSPLIWCPLFDNSMQIEGNIPTHASICEELIPIDEINDFTFSKSDSTIISLVPALSKFVNQFYIEFQFKGPQPKICVASPLQKNIYTFAYQIPSDNSEICGLLIDNERHLACVTLNGELLQDSVRPIEDDDAIIMFQTSELQSFTLNSGSMPYLFDLSQQIFEPSVGIMLEKSQNAVVYQLQTPVDFDVSDQHNFATEMVAPYIVTSAEGSNDYAEKLGFGYADSQNVTVYLSGKMNSSLASVTVPFQNATGIIERISQTHNNFQRNLMDYMAAISNLPYNEGCLCPENAERFKWIILCICLDKCKQKMSNEEKIDFFINLLTNTYCENSIYKPHNIDDFFNDKDCLTELCQTAMKTLLLDRSLFKGFPLYTLYPNTSSGSRISLHNAKRVLFVCKSCMLKSKIKLTDRQGCGITIDNGSNPIYIFDGDTINFEQANSGDIITAHIIPLTGKSNRNEFNYGFSLSFIRLFIEYVKTHKENKECIKILDDYIIYPLWKLTMTTNVRVYINYIADWLTVILDKEIFSEEMLVRYRKVLNIQRVIQDQPSVLTGILCLISVFLYKGQSLQSFIECVLDIDKSKQTFASLIFRQLSLELLNPFITKDSLLSNLPQSVISSIAIDALSLSLRDGAMIVRANPTETSKIATINSPDASGLAVMRVLPTTTASVSLKKSPIVPDCIIPGSGGTLKITKGHQDQVPYVLQIIPVGKKMRRHADDARRIALLVDEIRKKWTSEDEALAVFLSQISFQMNFPLLFAGMSDDLIRLFFPRVSVTAARFRCSLCLEYLRGTENCPQLDISSLSNPLLKGLFSALFPHRQLLVDPAKSSSILPPTLPTRNAQLSDFFSQLYDELRNSPLSRIFSLGTDVVGSLSEPHKISDVLLSLKNDMFDENGCPLKTSLSPKQMDGYLGFGLFGAICIASGRLLPFNVSDDVIESIVGGNYQETPQHTAIRLGASRIDKACVRMSVAREGRSYMKYFKLAAATLDSELDEQSYGASVISSPIFGPLIRTVCGGKKIKSVSKVSEFVFLFNSETGELTIPDDVTLLQSFQ
ncbi:CUB domain containing protein [Trichomonas vaginalis G3]|uniref:CUB domain containing protein n=1 Tax=Trichomonas vaginalis (strain ATCC PRA-98 / G3) TaxID=412133 RepID=A2EGW1_TRIV3|nr:putative ZZ type zinc finger domain containing protein family [Trichomonas vaginalis G3]EAY08095.1 CUB domain containing protein [Trichomonas vaginalis G3]KAI5496690.1 putative ZZ type zinc finger domain containing protein family [Trichomonas vaginalis G3]|eukprot:XP_001320318.1 CUB domain containing protein [Trichomonas vaginalis G3]